MSSDVDRCVVPVEASLVDAMRAIDRGGTEIALVVDDARLVGVLTDGDIRRALLSGASMDTPLAGFISPRFISVAAEAPRAQVLDTMQALAISQIPIVDENGRLVGLHLLREILGAVTRPHWAVVMAGGKGTRLGPVTERTPKSMLRVAGRPILERIVLHVMSFGIRHVFLAVNYLAPVIEEHFGDGSDFGCRIDYLREEMPLGTGGALSLLPTRPEHPLVVMNGDLVTNVDIGAMLAFHESGSQVATVAMRRYVHAVPFGCLTVDGDWLISQIEKPQLEQLVNAGIYILDPSLVAKVPHGTEFPLPSLIDGALHRKEPVRVFEVEDDWIDIGRREQLERATHGV